MENHKMIIEMIKNKGECKTPLYFLVKDNAEVKDVLSPMRVSVRDLVSPKLVVFTSYEKLCQYIVTEPGLLCRAKTLPTDTVAIYVGADKLIHINRDIYLLDENGYSVFNSTLKKDVVNLQKMGEIRARDRWDILVESLRIVREVRGEVKTQENKQYYQLRVTNIARIGAKRELAMDNLGCIRGKRKAVLKKILAKPTKIGKGPSDREVFARKKNKEAIKRKRRQERLDNRWDLSWEVIEEEVQAC